MTGLGPGQTGLQLVAVHSPLGRECMPAQSLWSCRSRSRSPGWRSRRSRSRSRSPRGHDLASMSYDEYLDDFQVGLLTACSVTCSQCILVHQILAGQRGQSIAPLQPLQIAAAQPGQASGLSASLKLLTWAHHSHHPPS